MTTEEILQQSTVNELVVKLPDVKLERQEYNAVKKAIELIGGKWKGGKTQGFVFEQDPTELLAEVAKGESRNLKKEYQFFPTPPDIAAQMISYLPPVNPFMEVLEPSAGDGALVKAFRAAYPEMTVDCCELMGLNRIKLDKVEGAIVLKYNDFPAEVAIDESRPYKICIGRYDIIIANPPFTKNQDIDHIMAMWKCLKPGGTLITLCSPSWQLGTYRKHNEFKEWLESMDVFPLTLPQKSFAESGTMITPLLLQITKPKAELPIPIPNNVIGELEVSGFMTNPCTPKDFDQKAAEFSKNHYSLNNTDMNLFTGLYELLDGIDVTLKVKRRNGQMIVDVLPSTGETLKVATLTGTPEEMDAGFMEAVKKPIEKSKGFILEMDALHKSMEEAKQALELKTATAKDKAANLKKDASKKTAPEALPKTPDPKKDVVKKEAPKKPKVEEPSLFA